MYEILITVHSLDISSHQQGMGSTPLVCCVSLLVIAMPGLFYSHSSIGIRKAGDIQTLLNHLMMKSDMSDIQTDRDKFLTGRQQ